MELKKILELLRQPLKKPKTYFGFPLDTENTTPPTYRSGSNQQESDRWSKQRGIAMITAIMVTSLMFISMADMMINGSVALQMALAHRDNIKTEYLAKSGENLAIFLITGDYAMDLFMFDQKINPNPADGPGDIWGMLNGKPIGANSVKMMSEAGGIKLSKVNDSKIFDTLEAFDGEFTIEVEDESSKLNVNDCAGDRWSQTCVKFLTALLSCPAEKEFLDKKKLKATEIVANITDWIDKTSSPFEGSKYSGESDPYSDRDPHVLPKNAPLDSLEELKQIADWDDDLHKVFSPYLTVHPIKEKESTLPININSSLVGMMACLTQAKGEECRRNSIIKMSPAKPKDQLDNVNDFKGVQGRLREVFCEDDVEKQKYFTYRSDTYRIKVKAEVGDSSKQLQSVIFRKVPNEQDKKLEFKASYNLLEWSML